MPKYKVEGYIKIPVDVIIHAEDEAHACAYAYEAVIDEMPSGFSVIPCGQVEYQFAGEDEKVIISASDDYEYDFNVAEKLNK